MLGDLLHSAQSRGCMENHLLNGYTHAHGGIVEILEAFGRTVGTRAATNSDIRSYRLQAVACNSDSRLRNPVCIFL